MDQIYQIKNTDTLQSDPYNKDNIYLVFQFFIHGNEERNDEIKYCLKRNVKLGLFKNIILLNERIYTHEEMGLDENEMCSVVQVNIGQRLKYEHLFLHIEELDLQGYVVFCNSDIFFDATISNLHKTCLSEAKSMYALLRFEFNQEADLSECKLFTYPRTDIPRKNSQDVWIVHTKQLVVTDELLSATNFMLGKPGCDNKITLIMQKSGYNCINEPYNIKTYHYHATQLRNYSNKDLIPPPYLFLEPVLLE